MTRLLRVLFAPAAVEAIAKPDLLQALADLLDLVADSSDLAQDTLTVTSRSSPGALVAGETDQDDKKNTAEDEQRSNRDQQPSDVRLRIESLRAGRCPRKKQMGQNRYALESKICHDETRLPGAVVLSSPGAVVCVFPLPR